MARARDRASFLLERRGDPPVGTSRRLPAGPSGRSPPVRRLEPRASGVPGRVLGGLVLLHGQGVRRRVRGRRGLAGPGGSGQRDPPLATAASGARAGRLRRRARSGSGALPAGRSRRGRGRPRAPPSVGQHDPGGDGALPGVRTCFQGRGRPPREIRRRSRARSLLGRRIRPRVSVGREVRRGPRPFQPQPRAALQGQRAPTSQPTPPVGSPPAGGRLPRTGRANGRGDRLHPGIFHRNCIVTSHETRDRKGTDRGRAQGRPALRPGATLHPPQGSRAAAGP